MSAEEKITISEDLLTRLKNYMNDPVYKETVENSSSYNERLVKERKTRLPFLDAQTGVAQSDCYIWSNKLDRMPGYYSAQLYSYPARRWRKKRRQYLLNHQNNYNSAKEAEHSAQSGENVNALSSESNSNVSSGAGSSSTFGLSNSGASVSTNGQNGIGGSGAGGGGGLGGSSNGPGGSGLNDTFEDSKDSWLRDYDDGSDMPDAGELDDPESDFDDYEEYSSRKKKSRRKESVKRKREYTDAEKPFQCDVCGARYKTRPGLSYHYSHSHQDSGGSASGAGGGGGSSAGAAGGGGGGSGNGNHSANGIRGGDEDESAYNSNASSASTPTHSSNSSSIHKGAHNSINQHPNLSSALGLSGGGGGGPDPRNRGAASPQTYCDFCLGDSTENKKTNTAEELVSCSDCGRSAHPTCLQFTANMILSVKKYRWQCIECKSCGLCGTSDND
ncbi:Zinc finger protein ubi-d4, partial [Tyrophagus putrescentiae]